MRNLYNGKLLLVVCAAEVFPGEFKAVPSFREISKERYTMRKFFIVLLLSVIILLPTTIFSEVGYSNLRGDYKIFFLNDSLDVIKQKANYLVERGEIRQSSINLPFAYETSVLGEDATLYFYFNQDKVYSIGIIFKTPYVTREGIDALSYFINDLKDMLTLTYGKAIDNQPAVFADLYSLYSFDVPKYQFSYGTGIEISVNNPYLPYFPKPGKGGIMKNDIIAKALEWESEIGIPRQEEMRQSKIKNAYEMAEADYLKGRQKDYLITYVYQWELPLNKTVSIGVLKRDFGCLAKIEIKVDNILTNSVTDFN